MEKSTVTANFPGIGPVEISSERAKQILNLQKIILAQRENESLNKKTIMKKGIIFIGPRDSGKSRKAREIANRCLYTSAVWINARENRIENPFVFSDCDENTQLVVIEDLNLISLLCFLHVISDGLVVNRMGKEPITINPRIIIEFQSWVTKEMLPKGASFTRRFDVFEFPTDKEIIL